MPLALSIKTEGFTEAEKALAHIKDGYPTVAARAINRALGTGQKVVAQAIGARYNIKSGDVKNNINLHKARKAEAFNPEAPELGGYLVRVNPAELDYVEIAEALLIIKDRHDLDVALGAKSKYIHAAAVAASDRWRGGGGPKIESGSEGAIDDD
jgi:hypothetical protein